MGIPVTQGATEVLIDVLDLLHGRRLGDERHAGPQMCAMRQSAPEQAAPLLGGGRVYVQSLVKGVVLAC